MRKRVLAWRGSDFPTPKVDLKKALSRLMEVRQLEALQHSLLAATKKDPQLTQRLQDPFSSHLGDAAFEARFLALLGHNDHAWDRAHEIGADIVAYWCWQRNVAFATEALILNFPLDESGVAHSGTMRGLFPYNGPWRMLRAQLVAAGEADYQAALQVAEQAMASSPLDLQRMLVLAFSECREWVRQVVTDSLAAGSSFHNLYLLASLADPDQIGPLLQINQPYVGHDYLGFKPLDFVPTLLARMGEAALPGLLDWASGASKAPDRRFLAELVSQAKTPLVADWMKQHAKDKIFGPFAAAYLEQPVENPAPPANSNQLEGLPHILQQPPWLENRPKKKAPKIQLEPAAFEERVHFSPELLKSLLARNEICQPQQFKKYTAKFPTEAPYLRFAERLCDLCDREWAIRAWNETDPDFWNIYSFRSEWDQTAERLLATFGPAVIPGFIKIAKLAPEKVYPALAKVESPRLATLFGELRQSKKWRSLAQNWLMQYPQAASLGLIPAALQSNKSAQAALRWLDQQGQVEFIWAAAKDYAVVAPVQELLSEDPLYDLPSKIPALPAWWRPQNYTRPRLLNGSELPLASLDHLATMLALSSLDQPYPGLELVRQACRADSLQEFATSLYEGWLTAGGPAKESWGFLVLGFWGGDAAVRQLAPQIRRWPGEGLSARATLGLDILGAIGSDLALTHLHAISQKLRFKALQDKALAKIEAIADARGLSLEELADRLVPTLELSAQGTLTLDFGARQFTAGLDEFLRPLLRDEQDKPLKELPKAGASDDQERAKVAGETWKAFKKDLKALATLQTDRLEQALSLRRRWKVDEFRQLLVEHPVLAPLVRRLLWGAYQNDQVSLFRVAEDGTWADLHDQLWEVPEGAEVGLVHPLEADLSAWRQIFKDYNILQPFPQIDRPVHRGPVPNYQGRLAGPGRILRLEKRGWRRGDLESGCIINWVKGAARLEIEEGGYVETLGSEAVKLGKLVIPDSCHRVDLSEWVNDLEWVLA